MKRGHVVGTKRVRRPRRRTIARLEQMGLRIAAQLAQTQPEDLLKFKP